MTLIWICKFSLTSHVLFHIQGGVGTKLAVFVLSSFAYASIVLLKHSCSIVGVNKAMQGKKANDVMQVAFMS